MFIRIYMVKLYSSRYAEKFNHIFRLWYLKTIKTCIILNQGWGNLLSVMGRMNCGI